MILSEEALRAELVDILRPRRTHGKPSVVADHLYSTDWRVITRCIGKHGLDGGGGFPARGLTSMMVLLSFIMLVLLV
jgi:hypothetical protein